MTLPPSRVLCAFGLFRGISPCLLLAATLSAAEIPDKLVSHGGTQWLDRLHAGSDVTIPGEVHTPYPTIHNLAVEWTIEGDDNLNGVVTVRFRAAGEAAWREAMPLRRVPAMRFGSETGWVHAWTWENKHSGSILDLEPDTEYEIHLRLFDPDGGEAERTVRARTRPFPAAMSNAPLKHATTESFASVYATAEPGDVILLAPGHYGQFHATRDGEPGKPIVIRADPHDLRQRDWAPGSPGHRQDVVFTWISLDERRHVHVEGVVCTGAITLFYSEDCAVLRCRIHAIWGVVSGWSDKWARWAGPHLPGRDLWPNEERTLWPGGRDVPPHSVNCTISDNVIVGITPWLPESLGAHGKNLGEGIEIGGPGNVISHNLVIGFRDSISLIEGHRMHDQICIDVYNNDVYSGADDGIEADYMISNCRIMRNRIVNSMRGIAAAPSFGGPNYLIRNVLYNTRDTWQLGRAGTGFVALHNTSVKHGHGVIFEPHVNSLLRNNLFLAGGPGALAIITRGELQPSVDTDYNGYGVAGGPFRARLGDVEVRSEEELRTRTRERHGVVVDLDVFAGDVTVPAGLFPALVPPDLRLRAGRAAIDAGVRIPNVNDDHTGRAPDLGAHEYGRSVPIYGPRHLAHEAAGAYLLTR